TVIIQNSLLSVTRQLDRMVDEGALSHDLRNQYLSRIRVIATGALAAPELWPTQVDVRFLNNPNDFVSKFGGSLPDVSWPDIDFTGDSHSFENYLIWAAAELNSVPAGVNPTDDALPPPNGAPPRQEPSGTAPKSLTPLLMMQAEMDRSNQTVDELSPEQQQAYYAALSDGIEAVRSDVIAAQRAAIQAQLENLQQADLKFREDFKAQYQVAEEGAKLLSSIISTINPKAGAIASASLNFSLKAAIGIAELTAPIANPVLGGLILSNAVMDLLSFGQESGDTKMLKQIISMIDQLREDVHTVYKEVLEVRQDLVALRRNVNDRFDLVDRQLDRIDSNITRNFNLTLLALNDLRSGLGEANQGLIDIRADLEDFRAVWSASDQRDVRLRFAESYKDAFSSPRREYAGESTSRNVTLDQLTQWANAFHTHATGLMHDGAYGMGYGAFDPQLSGRALNTSNLRDGRGLDRRAVFSLGLWSTFHHSLWVTLPHGSFGGEVLPEIRAQQPSPLDVIDAAQAYSRLRETYPEFVDSPERSAQILRQLEALGETAKVAQSPIVLGTTILQWAQSVEMLAAEIEAFDSLIEEAWQGNVTRRDGEIVVAAGALEVETFVQNYDLRGNSKIFLVRLPDLKDKPVIAEALARGSIVITATFENTGRASVAAWEEYEKKRVEAKTPQFTKSGGRIIETFPRRPDGPEAIVTFRVRPRNGDAKEEKILCSRKLTPRSPGLPTTTDPLRRGRATIFSTIDNPAQFFERWEGSYSSYLRPTEAREPIKQVLDPPTLLDSEGKPMYSPDGLPLKRDEEGNVYAYEPVLPNEESTPEKRDRALAEDIAIRKKVQEDLGLTTSKEGSLRAIFDKYAVTTWSAEGEELAKAALAQARAEPSVKVTESIIQAMASGRVFLQENPEFVRVIEGVERVNFLAERVRFMVDLGWRSRLGVSDTGIFTASSFGLWASGKAEAPSSPLPQFAPFSGVLSNEERRNPAVFAARLRQIAGRALPPAATEADYIAAKLFVTDSAAQGIREPLDANGLATLLCDTNEAERIGFPFFSLNRAQLPPAVIFRDLESTRTQMRGIVARDSRRPKE
ncbi:MAG: hypothetical protein RL417_1912, partial [Pseudomonadota bacterium]